MAELYKRLSELCEQRGITGYRMCKDCKLSPSTMTDLKSGRKKTVNADGIERLATYFGVSVSYLLGSNNKNDPADNSRITDEQLKFALAGDDGRHLTDEDMEKIRAFAAFTAQERRNKKE